MKIGDNQKAFEIYFLVDKIQTANHPSTINTKLNLGNCMNAMIRT